MFLTILTHRLIAGSIAVNACLMLLGCRPSNEFIPPPPPEVTVAQPLQQEVTTHLESTGRTEESARVDVRSRVSGYLESVHFSDGDMVSNGQLLYVIDPRPFQAQLDLAEAQLAQARAEYENSQSLFERAQNLFDQGATTDKDLTERRAMRDKAQASIAAAEAAVLDASLSLGFTHIRAPMDGRIGDNKIDVGNLVSTGENNLLATIVCYTPIYVYFTISERDLLSLIEKSRELRENEVDDKVMASAFMGLANEAGFPHQGVVDFADLRVDPQTGAMRLRAVFENQPIKYPDLIPGLFARIRIPIDRRADAILVPEKALSTDQTGKHVYVVDDQSVARKRNVRIGSGQGEMRVIEEGLSVDDWVVVEGLLKAREGAEVKPTRSRIDQASAELGAQDRSSATRTLLEPPPGGLD